jgi:hypothetical protein
LYIFVDALRFTRYCVSDPSSLSLIFRIITFDAASGTVPGLDQKLEDGQDLESVVDTHVDILLSEEQRLMHRVAADSPSSLQGLFRAPWQMHGFLCFSRLNSSKTAEKSANHHETDRGPRRDIQEKFLLSP